MYHSRRGTPSFPVVPSGILALLSVVDIWTYRPQEENVLSEGPNFVIRERNSARSILLVAISRTRFVFVSIQFSTRRAYR